MNTILIPHFLFLTLFCIIQYITIMQMTGTYEVNYDVNYKINIFLRIIHAAHYYYQLITDFVQRIIILFYDSIIIDYY